MKDFDINMGGASNASIKVLHQLRGNESGGSSLTYSGQPELVKVEVATDSEVSES